jgi:Uma2 family endonuclease
MTMRAVTRAAEGFDRRAFTVNEILRMQDAGIISEDENFELIEGEIVPMQAKSHIHERLKSALSMALARVLPETLWMGFETTIYLSENTFVEPDIVVYPNGMQLESVRGADILLAIEVAATGLAYDREFKAGLYAKHKIQEYWVVDAPARRTFQFAGPRGKGWRRRAEREPEDTLTHSALPGFSIRLSDY